MAKVSETRSHRRLVVVGKKAAAFSTMDTRIDNTSISDAVSVGLPAWNPRTPSEPSEPDYDLIRKQGIEDQL